MVPSKTDKTVEFSSSGMFIIDDVEHEDGSLLKNVIGGGGTWALLGARIWTPGAEAARLGLVIDVGTDFPEEVRTQLEQLGTGSLFRANPDRLTTHGYNYVHNNGFRHFEYKSPKRAIGADDLIEAGFHNCETLHVITNPTKFRRMHARLMEHRTAAAPPLIVWEPTPESCLPEHWDECQEAMKLCDIFSPNEVDSAGFFGVAPEHSLSKATEFAQAFSELQIGPNGRGWVVLRCGHMGSFIAPCVQQTPTVSSSSPRTLTHLPCFPMDPHTVVDTTGAGNTFCGTLIVEYHRTSNIIEAALKATVSASFAIQQYGLPRLTCMTSDDDDSSFGRGRDFGSRELWNGESASDRLQRFYAFLSKQAPDLL
ncbi:carbohydrate kinase [Schizosaccharomyces japonicus yFS275]|uniref:Carbohydrate kinase n=1 Tax=Schizosaccharomyces japonicus (strain yFS275 / FY16936) TaxID=402676 RepID=B6K5B0_SCHJY|nr:carbohydrate kinase [Schizosaccharomyces japonicus yFS275]EEB08714.1 carbohydrate kinase [Schizosaccharomyces japonicus yFS275]